MADKNSYLKEINEITNLLKTGIKDLFKSEKYKLYLKTMAKFHDYSTKNVILIHMQMPNATKVAGYNKWKNEFNHQVKKHEKSIRIYAPIKISQDKDTNKTNNEINISIKDNYENTITENFNTDLLKFKLVSVFDISQTTGEPLSKLAETLTGTVKHYEALIKALKIISPLPIKFEILSEDTDGYCIYGNSIEIRNNMSEIQTISAIIHEMAHSKLHDIKFNNDNIEQIKQKKQDTKEIEAESISYVVCQYFGIETSPNSFGYIADWSSNCELKELHDSLDTIRKTSNLFINSIENELKKILKEQNIQDIQEHQQATEPITNQDKQYELGFGHKGNGLTVWNKLQEENNDYVNIAHIDSNRNIDFYDKRMPDEIKEQIIKIAQTSNMTISYSQDTHVFITPPIKEQEKAYKLDFVPDGKNFLNVYARYNKINGEFTAIEDIASISPNGFIIIHDNLVDKIKEEIKTYVKELNLVIPDSKITVEKMNEYGYTNNDVFPLTFNRAFELFALNYVIYNLYPDNTEEMIFAHNEIKDSNNIYGIDCQDWLTSQECRKMRKEIKIEKNKLKNEVFANENKINIKYFFDSNYKDMSVIYDINEHVYLGKTENIISPLEKTYFYNNNDKSLIFISENEKILPLLICFKWTKTQQHLLDSGKFTIEDFKEFDNIQHNILDNLTVPKKFEKLTFAGNAYTSIENYIISTKKDIEYVHNKNNKSINNIPTVSEFEMEVKAENVISFLDFTSAVKNEKSILQENKSSIFSKLQDSKKNISIKNKTPKKFDGRDL